MPCVLGYNLWYFEASLPSGATGQILDIEDFLVSNLLLPHRLPDLSAVLRQQVGLGL